MATVGWPGRKDQQVKPETAKIKLAQKDPWSEDTLQWEMWIQHLLTSSDHFLGNPFYRADCGLSREITETWEGLQSFLLGKCFQPRFAIYHFLGVTVIIRK